MRQRPFSFSSAFMRPELPFLANQLENVLTAIVDIIRSLTPSLSSGWTIQGI